MTGAQQALDPREVKIRSLQDQIQELTHNGLPHSVKCSLQQSASRETFLTVLAIIDEEAGREKSFGDPDKDTIYGQALSAVREGVVEKQKEMGVA